VDLARYSTAKLLSVPFKCMLSEAYQCVAMLQLDSNCCSFIVIFAALSSATLKCERALKDDGKKAM